MPNCKNPNPNYGFVVFVNSYFRKYGLTNTIKLQQKRKNGKLTDFITSYFRKYGTYKNNEIAIEMWVVKRA